MRLRRRGSGAFGEHFQETSRQLGPGARLLVFEEHERFVPALGSNPVCPRAQVLLAVRNSTQTQVTPVGRGLERWIACFSRVRHTPGGAALTQRGVDGFVVPGGVPELEGGAGSRREQREEVAQPR